MGQVAAPPAVAAAQPPPGDDLPQRARRRPGWRVIVVAVVLLVVVAALTIGLVGSNGSAPLTQRDVDKAVQQGIAKAAQQAREAPADATVAYQKALPSLVLITATRKVGSSSGAGVVVSADGSILTALHVVENSTSISVRFADGTQGPASITTQQPSSDVAVLSPQQLPQVVVPAVLGGGAKIGDPVFALGHPLGLDHSLTAGVVSALGRTIRVSASQTLTGLIQFDAAVNPGSSGGPLLDRDGQVIGVVTGLANPSQQAFFVGIGFAVPIATAGGVAGSPPQ